MLTGLLALPKEAKIANCFVTHQEFYLNIVQEKCVFK